ncbi:TonB-dependent receptor plug domain-containing protein [Persicirhabdus sediminis]|uniref:TonB-dependent receptor n=1 Tax=Persicirhabdus sediminis TaxID=454144 RepID=A0A8J7MES9_9BACT|nr:TonB-dependent receptor [Persicirhabdus sediminis]MBK1791360.1 TonB-dependent receptor [Persicirhabdus sediminis]
MIKTNDAPVSGAGQLGFATSGKAKGVVCTFGLSAVMVMAGLAEEQAANESVLAETTILANKVEMELAKVGSQTTVLDVEQLDEQGIRTLQDALQFVPGVISTSTSGPKGQPSSIFLRGTNTSYTQLRVDGMRLNDANGFSSNFLSAAGMADLPYVEILRGPQGALYGADAIGGVVGVNTRQGQGEPSARVRAELGSFDSFLGQAQAQGQEGNLSYNAAIGYQTTDNDNPNGDARSNAATYSLRLDHIGDNGLHLGATVRGANSEYYIPEEAPPGESQVNELDYVLGTVFAQAQINELWHSKLTFGLYKEDHDSDKGIWGANSSNYQRHAAYWDNTLTWNENHTTVAGAVYERSRNETSYFGKQATDQFGGYVNHVWQATDALSLTGGLRWEDYDTYGDEFTWRLAGAYVIEQTGTIVRSSVGTGYKPPSEYAVIHAKDGRSLSAESSIGWDFGIEQAFCDRKYVASVTYFDTRIDDAVVDDGYFDYDTYESVSEYVNLSDRQQANGIEAAFNAKFLNDRILAQLTYTWLDNNIAGKSSQGQPRNSGSARLHGVITDELGAGFTVNYYGSRDWGFSDPLSAYTLVGLYANYELTENVTLNARVENLFDEDYEYAAHGYNYLRGDQVISGNGRGIYGGVTVTW